MPASSELVQSFFTAYEQETNAADPNLIAARYADTFLFAAPQAVRKEDFLGVLPRRQAFFRTVGLTQTTIQALEATPIDESYVLVKNP